MGCAVTVPREGSGTRKPQALSSAATSTTGDGQTEGAAATLPHKSRAGPGQPQIANANSNNNNIKNNESGNAIRTVQNRDARKVAAYGGRGGKGGVSPTATTDDGDGGASASDVYVTEGMLKRIASSAAKGATKEEKLQAWVRQVPMVGAVPDTHDPLVLHQASMEELRQLQARRHRGNKDTSPTARRST